MELKLNLHASRILFQEGSSNKWQFSTKVGAPSRMISEDFFYFYFLDFIELSNTNKNTISTSKGNFMKVKALNVDNKQQVNFS